MSSIITSHRVTWLSFWLILTIILFFYLNSFLDPDFGWQLQTGNWILTHHQIPHVDLFSYTMPTYPWRYPAWLSEAIFALLYQVNGYATVAFVCAAAISAAFILPLIFFTPMLTLIPLALSFTATLFLDSTRPKTFSLLLTTLVFTILHSAKRFPSRFQYLPLIFFIWANLHGAFLLPLLIVTAFTVTTYPFNHYRRIYLYLILSWLVTLLNPFGSQIYQEIFTTVFSGPLNNQIQEWQPLSLANTSLILYLTSLIGLFLTTRSKPKPFTTVTSIILFILALIDRRLLEFFFLLTLIPFTSLLQSALDRYHVLKKYLIPLTLTVIILASIQSYSVFQAAHYVSESAYYPQAAVIYLQNHLPTNNLFSVYNWGGYLIYRLPQKKVFVDGRMAIWRQNEFSAFSTERAILTGQTDYRLLFKQFNIDTALMPSDPTRSTFSDQLVHDGWQVLYQDSKSIILTHPTPQAS